MTQDKVELYWSLMELLTPEEKIRMAKKLIEAVPEDFEVELGFEERIALMEAEAKAKRKAVESAAKARLAKLEKAGEDDEEDDKDANKIVTDVRKLKNFTGIDSAGCVNVRVTKGDEFKVEVIGRKKDVKYIKTSVSKGVLRISVDSLYSIGGGTIVSGNNIVSAGGIVVVNGRVVSGGGGLVLEPVRVEVTMPQFLSLASSGSGDISVESDFTSDDDIILCVEGSGNITSQKLECKGFGGAIKGSGNIRVSQLNTKDDIAMIVKGSGNLVVTSAYIAGDSEFEIKGSGDIRINGSTNNVSAKIKGSGNISGNLKYSNINSSCMGSGSIRLAGYTRRRGRFDF